MVICCFLSRSVSSLYLRLKPPWACLPSHPCHDIHPGQRSHIVGEVVLVPYMSRVFK